MLPCKAVISKYLIYAQLPSHEPQHFAFRTKLWQRNLTQCTDLGTSSPHRLSGTLMLETGKRKEGMPRLMPSPILWWVKIFIVADCYYNYPVHGVSRSAVGVCMWTVSATSGRTMTMSRSPLSTKISSLFIFCSITSLIYEQFSYKWTVNHVGLKRNECFSKLRSPNAHFKYKRQVAALKTKYSDLT